jgi:flagellar motor switch protein FliM
MNPPTSPSPAPEAAPAPAAADVSVLTSRGGRERRPADTIRPHDFRQSGFLAPSELRRIRMRHEQFVRGLAARLAIFLRVEFSVRLARLQIMGYQKFIGNLPSPTHITLFKTDPLKGTGLLVIPPRLGLSLVDRLLGGPGQSSDANRDLSEIEVALIDQVAMLLITEWCNHWPEQRELHPSLIGHENNSRYLQTAAPDAAMLVLTLDSGFSNSLEPVQLVFPYATVEPLMRLLSPASRAETEAGAASAATFHWKSEFDDIPVPVVAEWQGLKMSAGDITRLKHGDVLMLDPGRTDRVEVSLSRIPKFTGRPGMRAGKWAIELTGPSIP